MKPNVSRDLETRIRLFASERGRVPTASEVWALMAELGLTRDSVADLAEDVASASGVARGPSRSTLAESAQVALRGPKSDLSAGSATLPQAVCPTTQHGSTRTAGPRTDAWEAAAPPVAGGIVSPPPLGAGSPSPTPSADAVVRRLVDDLTDDWYRQGGRLSDDDVTRLVAKRGLSAPQQAAALEALAYLGISVERRRRCETARLTASRPLSRRRPSRERRSRPTS